MTPTKRKTVIWSLLATSLLVLNTWHWGSVAFQRGENKVSPPLQSKVARSPPTPPQLSYKDLRTDFLSRCEAGLTVREIRWIVTDFQNAGLDFNWENPRRTDEQLFALRIAQHRWYVDLLKDGLRLTPEQSRETADRLTPILDQGKAEFLKAREISNGYDNPADAVPRLVDASQWLPRFNYPQEEEVHTDLLPNNLCHLTPVQDQILKGGKLPIQPIPGGEIFPFSRLQKFLHADKMAVKNDPATLQRQFLNQIRALHPAQFKTLLLIYPKTAAEISSTLEKYPD